jgi:hypothetical protein
MATNDELDEAFADMRASLNETLKDSMDMMRRRTDQAAILAQLVLLTAEQCQLLAGIYAELSEARHDRRGRK